MAVNGLKYYKATREEIERKALMISSNFKGADHATYCLEQIERIANK